MIRRTHKKSRQGCAECKRSRKKCDESHPACVNCVIAKRQCSFVHNIDSRKDRDDDKFIRYTGPDSPALTPSAASHTTASTPLPVTPAPLDSAHHVNLLHLELFQNISSDSMSFTDSSKKQLWLDTVLRYGFSYSYLMYQTLALSAFNLSTRHPSKASLYLSEATALQAHALSLFNASNPTINQDNLIPGFMFSGGLGLYFFCETFLTPSADIDTLIDRLVQSIRLLRGVRAVLGGSWELIMDSDIKCLLAGEDSFQSRDDEVTQAFEDLRTIFASSHALSAFESSVYCEAIASLTKVYSSFRTDVLDGPSGTGAATSWPIQLTADYTELLDQRKPEALIVMAYFSILLYRWRSFWAVGEAGRFLLTTIEESLGHEWSEWLVVPRRLVIAQYDT